MKSKLLVVSLTLLSTSTFAQDYQSISSISYSKTEFGNNVDFDSVNLQSKYYFDAKKALGPLDQFSYINTVSNAFASYTKSEFSAMESDFNVASIGGEYFHNNLLFSGSFSRIDRGDTGTNYSTISLGYLFSKNLLIQSSAARKSGEQDQYRFSVKYNQQLTNKDYIGYTLTTDDNFDHQTVAVRYFTELNQSQFWLTDIMYVNYKDSDNFWAANTRYYFSPNSAISLGYSKDDSYTLGVKHYINKSYAINFDYDSNTNEHDLKSYNVSLIAQF